MSGFDNSGFVDKLNIHLMKSKIELRKNQLEKSVKTYTSRIVLPLFASLSLTGCSVVEGIFKTGVWLGIIISVLIVALLIWGIVKVVQKLK